MSTLKYPCVYYLHPSRMNDFRTRRRCFETRSIASLGDARSASVLPPLRQLPFSVRAMPVNFSCTGITRYFFSFFFFFPIVIILLANFYQNSIIGFCFSKRVFFCSFRNNSFSKRFILFEFLSKSNRYCFS